MQFFRTRFDYPDLPTSLRRYVVSVALIGSAMACLIPLLFPAPDLFFPWSLMILLPALSGIADRFPLHLTHKTSVNVGTALYLAMILLLPWQLPALLAFGGALIAQLSRTVRKPEIGFAEPLFNAGQVALYTLAGVSAVEGFRHVGLISSSANGVDFPALVVASSAMHLANTGLVAIVAALQMGIAPFRVWWHNLALDLTPQVTLTVLGAVTFNVAHASPYYLPVLLIPGFLVHRAVGQSVRLRVDTHEALASLVEVVELRDPYTAGHSRRVAQTARALALRLGLTAEEADEVETAGRVHDIGKVALDPAILSKTSALTNDEWHQMRQHPVFGANVVERFAAYQHGTALVRHHHEAFDGSGYPSGLAGEAIPLGARILAVADTFDALTSDRPYRTGMALAKARAILTDGAGTQWDPRVVQALLDQLDESPGTIPILNRDEQSATVHSELARPAA